MNDYTQFLLFGQMGVFYITGDLPIEPINAIGSAGRSL
jgi:hypothetical protein